MRGKEFCWYDPRVAAIRYLGWFVVGYLALFFLFGTYGNYRVLELRGGITDGALPADNPYRQMHEYVRAKEGFAPAEWCQVRCSLPTSRLLPMLAHVQPQCSPRSQTPPTSTSRHVAGNQCRFFH